MIENTNKIVVDNKDNKINLNKVNSVVQNAIQNAIENVSNGIENNNGAIVNLNKGSLATSGNYRNCDERDRKKYAHTIDPRAGASAFNELLSVSVFHHDCAIADA